MIELFLNIAPLLVVDALNPVLFALMVLAVGTDRPIANSSALLAGHTGAYFVSGVVIALGLDPIVRRLGNPEPVDFVIELAIGLFCLWAAFSSRDGQASKEREPGFALSPLGCFGYGAIVNFLGVPFALPYFAVVDQLLKANLSVESSLVVLAVYNIAYVLPFLLVPILVALMGDASRPILETINRRLTSLVDTLMPLLLFLVGAALIADGLVYLYSGERLA